MNKPLTAVVIPCLNEEHNLPATCQSLGFGAGGLPPSDTALILVDNDSEDATRAVAEDIQKALPNGSVIVATEGERGYVPPRRCGNLIAIKAAADRGVSVQDLLIVQADADTLYAEGYIEAIGKTARQARQGVMVDARCEIQSDCVAKYREYFKLCDEVDMEFDAILSDQSHDLIIDDKACAYWASDYQVWGGHQREYTNRGDEIHSETTRLYMRARAFGATRCLCDDAIARHSGRRIISDPAYSFATAGFPRETSFKARWTAMYEGPKEIVEFAKESNRVKIAMAVQCRRAHLQGLFQMLTTQLRLVLEPAEKHQPAAHKVLNAVASSNVTGSRETPGAILEAVFGIVDDLAFANR